MEQHNSKPVNPLLCDPATGVCELPGAVQEHTHSVDVISRKPVTIVYFTDPICSTCWGIEPQLRKLKLEYGADVEVEYHMGGLLPDWSYNSGGISKPSDVAHHWDEVSKHYNMPIDGDVWLEDPLPSSYPPSIAFKAAQLQDKDKAVKYLRILREMLFLEKKNITRWEHLSRAALQAGLDAEQLKNDYEGHAATLFRSDLEMAKQWHVRGFPSVFITDGRGNKEFIYGFKPYEVYTTAIEKISPTIRKAVYEKSWEHLFQQYPTLTTREFTELSDQTINQSEVLLEELLQRNELVRLSTKNGVLWKRKHYN
ncbi:MAG TPA: ClpXP adapter SpxH family protein [Chitinophaga sp.]|uniref:ClpXP adapter SpxH family protein n=1 Tax=Chitinophaga sp. TaxID=1869181 RepID=UPI002BF8CBB5|nr:ClpXP adapter SpxH family protein [Chitinophaga sp.]HVI45068.1 ClpXP adapter SpxH family protein [Chitinophaga sp.]